MLPVGGSTAGEAQRIPHPAGETAPLDVTTAPFFETTHPVVIVSITYPQGRNVTQLARDTIDALASAGWTVDPPTLPGGRMGDYALVSAHKDGFNLSCTLGDRDKSGPLLLCNLSV